MLIQGIRKLRKNWVLWIRYMYYKYFMMVIYYHNGNGLYYKTATLANLALAKSVNYDCKVPLQFVAYLLWS